MTKNELLLKEACKQGNVKRLKKILKKRKDKPDINMQFENGYTALMLASGFGKCEITKILIVEGVNIDILNDDKRTALAIAFANGFNNIVRVLLEANARTKYIGLGDIPILIQSLKSGELEMASLLIEYNVDIDTTYYGRFPLELAIEDGYLECAEAIIKKSTNLDMITQDGYSALEKASTNGYLNLVKLMIEKGADINIGTFKGRTSLMSACNNEHIEVVKYLVDNGADLNVVDKFGRSALSIAISNLNLHIIELLCSSDADVNLVANSDSILMHGITTHGYEAEIIQILLNKGADVNLKVGSRSALSVAKSRGKDEIVELLKLNGAIE